jgi:HlyD family secretion protein
VFVVEGGRAHERSVKIGHINDEFGEAVEGLAEGQSVVLNPGNALAEGKRVKPR